MHFKMITLPTRKKYIVGEGTVKCGEASWESPAVVHMTDDVRMIQEDDGKLEN